MPAQQNAHFSSQHSQAFTVLLLNTETKESEKLDVDLHILVDEQATNDLQDPEAALMTPIEAQWASFAFPMVFGTRCVAWTCAYGFVKTIQLVIGIVSFTLFLDRSLPVPPRKSVYARNGPTNAGENAARNRIKL